jgi:hypothetical protein
LIRPPRIFWRVTRGGIGEVAFEYLGGVRSAVAYGVREVVHVLLYEVVHVLGGDVAAEGAQRRPSGRVRQAHPGSRAAKVRK